MGSPGRKRVAIEAVSPEVDAGRFPAACSVGEKVAVEADIFADGQDALGCVMRYRHEGESDWTEVPMVPLVNDRWRAEFVVTELGRYGFTIEAWVDPFATWSRQFARRVEAGQDVTPELDVAARIVEAAAVRASGPDSEKLLAYTAQLRKGKAAATAALGSDLVELMERHADRSISTTYVRQVEVLVEPQRARYGAWYEMFPRSAGKEGKHGTFRDVEGWLPYISGMGFDVLYFPPIHPIGHTNRKTISSTSSARPGPPASRSRWTSRSSARPTTPTHASTRSGSAIAPTARFSTRRTRPRNTRTSIRSTSNARPGPSCGRSCSRS